MTTAVVKEHYQNTTVAQTYDRQRFASLGGRLFDALEKRALRQVVRRVLRSQANPAVLDIPCGTGRITGLLLALGLRVTGGDISQQMMQVARRRCAAFADRVSFQRLDLDRLALPDDSFDLVTCIRLFHHLDSAARAAVLSEVARVSRRYVVINVSFSSPYYRARRRLKRRLGQGVSRQSSTAHEIEAEAAAAGLRVVHRRFVLPGASEDLVLLLQKAA